ncbi:MAG: tail fiber protein [Bacteroidales bacterium]|nr:tail fiber protein [Bacteroidales bacterium]
MATNQITARHIVCTKTASAWASYTIIPLKGEICLEGDTGLFKFGNGTDKYADLPYAAGQIDGDGNWIQVTKSNGVATVEHIGPSGTSSDAATSGAVAAFGNGTSIVTGVKVDAKGHVTGVTKENATNITTMASAASAADQFVTTGGASRVVKASGYTRSTTVNSSSTDSQIPTAKAVQDAINSALTSAMRYKGTITKFADLPTSGQKVGDTYVASAGFTHAPTGSSTLPAGSYETGDLFFWNGTMWDAVNGENQVENNAPTVRMDGGTYTIGTVDGTALQVKTDNLDFSSPSVDGDTIAFIDTISQTDGKVSATKKNVRAASTSQTGVVQLQDSVDATTTKAATPNAVKAAIEALDVPIVGGSGKYIESILENDGKIQATERTLPTAPNGYGQVTVSAQSAATTNSAGNSTATTLKSVGSNETLKITSANKWVNISGTDSTTAGSDEVKISHAVGTIATTGGGLKKISYDNAGHITAASDVTSGDIGGKLTDLAVSMAATGATSTTSNNAQLKATVTAFGKTASTTMSAATLPTSLLKDDANVTLIIDGNF